MTRIIIILFVILLCLIVIMIIIQGDFAAPTEVALRVDAALLAETTKHFAAQAEINGQKLRALFKQQTLEGDKFGAELDLQTAAVCKSARVPPVDPAELRKAEEALAAAHRRSLEGSGSSVDGGSAAGPGSAGLTLEAFEAEERRVWRVAQRDMAANERFSLATAFGLQLRRVDGEWAAHEEQMHSDYLAQKADIEGR
jgi:hypothetical protein